MLEGWERGEMVTFVVASDVGVEGGCELGADVRPGSEHLTVNIVSCKVLESRLPYTLPHESRLVTLINTFTLHEAYKNQNE